MTRYQQVEEYILDWNLVKLVPDQDIRSWVRAWHGEFDARELVKGLIECDYLREAA